MKFYTLSLLVLTIAISACKGEKSQSDDEKIESSIRSYLFLGDSIDVEIEFADTIRVEELDGMLSATEENLKLIQLDIDTLGTMIDDLSYNLQSDSTNATSGEIELGEPVSFEKFLLTSYKLQYAALNNQKNNFSQTNRVLYHLKRSVWADIAGFDVIVKYEYNGEPIETMVLVDANYRVID